jgi:ABC-type transport system substrate-binding protein
MSAQETLAAALAAKLTEELGWDWKGERFEDVCMRGGSMDVPSGRQVIQELAESLASVVPTLPNITIVPDDAIIPGLGAELRGCIEEYLSGWASTDNAVQPLVGSYFAEGLSDLLSDQIGPILAAARAAGGRA